MCILTTKNRVLFCFSIFFEINVCSPFVIFFINLSIFFLQSVFILILSFMSDIYMSSAYHILCANFPVFLRQGACLLAVYLLFACPITVIWILFSGFEEIGSNLFAERQLFGSYFPDLLDKCPFCLLGYSFLVPASWFRREYVHFT